LKDFGVLGWGELSVIETARDTNLRNYQPKKMVHPRGVRLELPNGFGQIRVKIKAE
jgi:hypothetical protein